MAQIRKKQDTINISLDNAPIQVELVSSAGGIITFFDVYKSFKTYDGNLSSKDFKNYLKEMTALYKDFDDIFGEINRKYKLTEEK